MDDKLLIVEQAKKLIVSPLSEMLTQARVVDGGLLWPIDLKNDLYLLVNCRAGFVNYSTGELVLIKTPVTTADLWIFGNAIAAFIDDLEFRIEMGASGVVETSTTRSKFHQELDYNRNFATVYYTKRAIELGPEKLGLNKTKIVGDRMFFPVYDDGKTYLVYELNAQHTDVKLFTASDPTIESCVEKQGILVDTSINILHELRSWVQEAGG